MTPIKQKMGQSQMTFDKQAGLSAILRQHIATVQTILSKHGWARKYHYIDLTAGSGHNDAIDCEGSPVIFQRAMQQETRLIYDAHFIDKESANTRALCNVIRTNGCSTIHTGDHSDIAPRIVQEWSAYAYGLIYADTNGVPPFELLADLSRKPKLYTVDFLIRYTGSGVKRAGYRLLDELKRIQKSYWIVRDLDIHDKWQWTFLLGLNWNGLKAMQGQGFYYANSHEGRAIIERLHFTKPELAELKNPPYETYQDYLNHPKYKAVRAQARARSGGICEQCHKGRVTEVHHIEYPPWGTFETDAESLLALCHECHCKIHDKEN